MAKARKKLSPVQSVRNMDWAVRTAQSWNPLLSPYVAAMGGGSDMALSPPGAAGEDWAMGTSSPQVPAAALSPLVSALVGQPLQPGVSAVPAAAVPQDNYPGYPDLGPMPIAPTQPVYPPVPNVKVRGPVPSMGALSVLAASLLQGQAEGRHAQAEEKFNKAQMEYQQSMLERQQAEDAAKWNAHAYEFGQTMTLNKEKVATARELGLLRAQNQERTADIAERAQNLKEFLGQAQYDLIRQNIEQSATRMEVLERQADLLEAQGRLEESRIIREQVRTIGDQLNNQMKPLEAEAIRQGIAVKAQQVAESKVRTSTLVPKAQAQIAASNALTALHQWQVQHGKTMEPGQLAHLAAVTKAAMAGKKPTAQSLLGTQNAIIGRLTKTDMFGNVMQLPPEEEAALKASLGWVQQQLNAVGVPTGPPKPAPKAAPKAKPKGKVAHKRQTEAETRRQLGMP